MSDPKKAAAAMTTEADCFAWPRLWKTREEIAQTPQLGPVVTIAEIIDEDIKRWTSE